MGTISAAIGPLIAAVAFERSHYAAWAVAHVAAAFGIAMMLGMQTERMRNVYNNTKSLAASMDGSGELDSAQTAKPVIHRSSDTFTKLDSAQVFDVEANLSTT